jgi:hypothetical protein
VETDNSISGRAVESSTALLPLKRIAENQKYGGTMIEDEMQSNPDQTQIGVTTNRANKRIQQTAWIVIGVVVVFLLGLSSGYLRWGQDETAKAKQKEEATKLYEQISPKEGYNFSVSYGALGPQLIESGVISYDAFAEIYKNAGTPLTAEEIKALKDGSDQPIVINAQNARFLLNFFWAVGLANKNPILTEGPMVQYSDGKVEGFASTGGWSLATRPVSELYASLDLIPLTPEQQKLVEEVASQIYRPCCNNHTLFPDCNHGMAMLGIMELMASKGATADQMLEAAKYINAFWFPQQTLETAMFLKMNQDVDFAEADPKLVVAVGELDRRGDAVDAAIGAVLAAEILEHRALGRDHEPGVTA